MSRNVSQRRWFDLPARRWVRVTRALAFFGRRHRRWFAAGAISSLFVVALRLVLPWPLRALLDPWLGDASGGNLELLAWIPAGVSPVVVMAGSFLVVILLLGLADHVERICFARFAIGTVRDFRAEAYRSVLASGLREGDLRSGDLVARLIGDAARVKAGMKGFLVHVGTNGMMFVGVTVVLLWISVPLGLFFVAAGVPVAVAIVFGACAMYHNALRFRTKEGKLADSIHDSWQSDTSLAFAEVNRSSGEHEAALTRIQGRTTWFAHIALGLAIVLTLGYGARAVSDGRVAAGDLLVVMMYALMIRAPIVQLARQGVRTGKILACADRLEQLLSTAPADRPNDIGPLRCELRIEDVRVSTRRGRTRHRRLGPVELIIPAGQRVAVLGKPGSAKTTLLELIAGVRRASAGRLLWDGTEISNDGHLALRDQVAFLPHSPTWPRRRVRELLEMPEGPIDQLTATLLRTCGAKSLLKRLPGWLDTRLGSSELSTRECTALALAALVRGKKSVWVLDDPVGRLEKRRARKLIKTIVGSGAGKTLLVSMSRPVRLGKFDRVIVLKRGRIAFDGTPAAWRAESRVPGKRKSRVTKEVA